jgi:hypothetical protein
MEQTLTLFFDLEEGAKVDLATAARAALAFDRAVRELAFFVDASLEIDLELDSGTAGSLKLNSIIKTIRQGAGDPKTLKTVAISAATWFALNLADYTLQSALDAVFKREAPTLSDADREEIARDIVKMIHGEVGRREVEEIYRAAEQDPNITGLGVGLKRDRRPAIVVPRARFPDPSDLFGPSVVTQLGEDSKEIDELTLTLISPVLVRAHRRWKFHHRDQEFGATMMDDEFLDRVLAGREPIQLTAGIRMRVLMRTRIVEIPDKDPRIERRILRVLHISPGPRQLPFDFSPPPEQP